MEAHKTYFEKIDSVLRAIRDTQLPAIEALANAFADALEADRRIFLFGTGHSHMLAEEVFYRAGGLVKLEPILEDELMLHVSASGSTLAERKPGVAEGIAERYGMAKGDVIVIISNSGRNGVCIDLAMLAKEKGLTVAALTNLNHARGCASRHPSGKKLYELADIVLDNCGCPGDACVYFEALGRNASPTSTVAGAAILNAAVAGAIERMLENGFPPEVFASSNVDGGDEINDAYVNKYRGRIRSL